MKMIIKVHLAWFLGRILVEQIERQKGSKKEAIQGHARETTSAAPFQAIQVILMPFQVFIMSMKYPKSNPK